MTRTSDGSVQAALRVLAEDRYDQAAWRVLFDVLWPYVVAVCARLHGDDVAAAQDSAQESLVRLARYAPFEDLQELAAVQAYLRAVCRRVVRSYYAKAENRPTAQIDDEALIASDAFDPEEEASTKLLFDAILSELEESDQRLLRMVTAGYSLDHIATELGIQYGAVAVRVHRLRARVRKWLQHL